FLYRDTSRIAMASMKAHLRRVGPMKFQAQAEGAPAILLHSPPMGEPKDAPSPVQAVLLAAMGCTAADVESILTKERQDVRSIEIEAEAERSEEPPKVFTSIRLHYVVRGAGVKRAIDLSTETYCSVGAMLRRGGVAWSTSYEIRPPD
ncbi:MAG: OsmC family protein, partial [Methanobacteriota archaeon]